MREGKGLNLRWESLSAVQHNASWEAGESAAVGRLLWFMHLGE